jgi:tRNA-specific 2-thiouridylase
VCFITSTGGRQQFLGDRLQLHPARVLDHAGAEVGRVDAVELVTIGQRRGLGVGGGDRRYVVAVDVPARTVRVGAIDELLVDGVEIADLCWVDTAPDIGTSVAVQVGAHGRPRAATFTGTGVAFDSPQTRVAPGQSVVLYAGDDDVLGGGIAVTWLAR